MSRACILAIGLVVLLSVSSPYGCGGETGVEEKPSEQVSARMQQFLVNQWVDISFRNATYSAQNPMQVESRGTGIGHYMVEGWEMRHEMGVMAAAVEGYEYLLILMRVKGDSGNPQTKGPIGPLVHPAYFEETGTNPSPRFVLFDAQGNQYQQRTSISWAAANATGRENLTSIEFSDSREHLTTVAFQIPEAAEGLRLRVQVWEDKEWVDAGEWPLQS